MEQIFDFIQNNALAVSSSILVIAYIFIAWEKISKVTIAMIGAGITLLLGLLAQNKGHDAINPHYFINFVDFNVIFLLISMMIIVAIASRSGIFTWVANALLKKTKGHPVFIAQHATACCCRGCLFKWHKIPKERELTSKEKEFIKALIMSWIEREYKNR